MNVLSARASTVARSLALAGLAMGAFGCGSLAPQASTPPVLGIDWGRAASVERPANYEETVSPTYQAKHPILRIQGQATMADLIGLPKGGFVSVGYAPPDWVPVAWTSADGNRWAFHATLDETDFTFPLSLAVGGDGTVVAVGRSGREPIAWTTKDGIDWQRHTVAILGGDGTAERMTAVVGGPSGFVAGGSVGPELFERHARFWRSADGIDWTPVADDRVAFANAEVRAITRLGNGFVAVGVVGTAQEHTGAVAWTSPDGATWTRVDDHALDGGEAVAVAPAPWGGVIAVGATVGRQNAAAWISPDGRSWTRAPDEASRQHSGGFAWMTDVVAIGDQVIGVGDVQGLQRGTAVSWVTRDGLTWAMSLEAPVQEGAEFYAITPGGAGAFAVGAFGAPDSYVPEVWVTPGR
ncbi:MAG: hypothetical protein HYX55_11210 [Chloroflexi bacterium]|nr:hypothetical protein [Chloroflexota bacterium]